MHMLSRAQKVKSHFPDSYAFPISMLCQFTFYHQFHTSSQEDVAVLLFVLCDSVCHRTSLAISLWISTEAQSACS